LLTHLLTGSVDSWRRPETCGPDFTLSAASRRAAMDLSGRSISNFESPGTPDLRRLGSATATPRGTVEPFVVPNGVNHRC
jgi:hypothetical protein